MMVLINNIDKVAAQRWFKKTMLLSKNDLFDFLSILEHLTRIKPLSESIECMVYTSEGVIADILLEMQDSAQQTGMFTKPLLFWLPQEISASLVIAEERGYINEALKNGIQFLGNGSDSYVAAIMSKCLYPGGMCCFSLVFSKNIHDSLMKEFEPALKKMKVLPPEVIQLKALAWFAGYPLVLSALFMLCIGAFITYYLRNHTGNSRRKLDPLPVFYDYRLTQSLIFLRNYYLLLKNNLKTTEIINILKSNTEHPYLKNLYSLVMSNLGKGIYTTASSLDVGLLDKKDLYTLKMVPETHGNGFVEMVDIVSKNVQLRIRRRANNAATYLMIFLFVLFVFLISPAARVLIGASKYA